jgi:hypothetical protein
MTSQIDSFALAVGYAVMITGGLCLSLGCASLLFVWTLNSLARVFWIHRNIIEYIWHRQAFKAWLNRSFEDVNEDKEGKR